MNNGTTKRTLSGLGRRVRSMRLAMNLTLQVAATRGGTTPQTWLQLERFDLATTRTLNNVCKVLGLTVDELLGAPKPTEAA